MKIPLCKPSISSNEINLVAKTLKSNWLTHGPYNYKFEELFTEYMKNHGSKWFTIIGILIVIIFMFVYLVLKFNG